MIRINISLYRYFSHGLWDTASYMEKYTIRSGEKSFLLIAEACLV
jgi:hypothetical protein